MKLDLNLTLATNDGSNPSSYLLPSDRRRRHFNQNGAKSVCVENLTYMLMIDAVVPSEGGSLQSISTTVIVVRRRMLYLFPVCPLNGVE